MRVAAATLTAASASRAANSAAADARATVQSASTPAATAHSGMAAGAPVRSSARRRPTVGVGGPARPRRSASPRAASAPSTPGCPRTPTFVRKATSRSPTFQVTGEQRAWASKVAAGGAALGSMPTSLRAVGAARACPHPAYPAAVRILGIDTSCDDTGVGIVETAGGRGADGGAAAVLANVVASQAAVHAPYGGVLPEQASREHLSVIDAVVGRALDEAGLGASDLDAVAATYGPGLAGALLVGLSYGKGLAWGLGVPFVKVHHLEGHLAAAVPAGGLRPPYLCLIASGGHTVLFDVPAEGEVRQLGAASTMPRARPSTRSRACWASASPAARRWRRSPPRAIPMPSICRGRSRAAAATT